MNCRTIPQKNIEPIDLASVSVYLDFKKRGYTTAAAYTHFDDLEKVKTKKILVSKYDCEMLEKIINRAERRKHFQTKFGGNLIFCEAKFTDQSYPNLSRIVISIGMERAFITNLTLLHDYFITDQSDLKWLSEFSDYLKSQ